MSNKQVIFDAVIGLAVDQVEAAPVVEAAWQEFVTVYDQVDGALVGAGQRSLSMILEAAVNAYASELVRAAFVAGLAFDGRALLLEAASL